MRDDYLWPLLALLFAQHKPRTPEEQLEWDRREAIRKARKEEQCQLFLTYNKIMREDFFKMSEKGKKRFASLWNDFKQSVTNRAMCISCQATSGTMHKIYKHIYVCHDCHVKAGEVIVKAVWPNRDNS